MFEMWTVFITRMLSLSTLVLMFGFPCSAFFNPSIYLKSVGHFRQRSYRTTVLCKNAVLSTTSSTESRTDIANLLRRGQHLVESLRNKLGVPSRRSVRARLAKGTVPGFGGIVDEIGVVSEISAELLVPGVTLTVDCSEVIRNSYDGCLLAINGVAVPIVECGRQYLRVGL